MSYKINKVNNSKASLELNTDDSTLLKKYSINNVFDTSSNFIQIRFKSKNNTLLLVDNFYNSFSILENREISSKSKTTKLVVDPEQDIEKYLLKGNDLKITYKFFNNIFNKKDFSYELYIDDISDDRTELTLKPITLEDSEFKQFIKDLETKINQDVYIEDYILTTSNNTNNLVTNVKHYKEDGVNKVALKLYQSLDATVELNTKATVLEEISNPVEFTAEYIIPKPEEHPKFIKGPNFKVDIEDSAEQSEYLNYDELLSYQANTTTKQIDSLLNEKSIELGIDYTNVENFITFSSLKERLLNFRYKLKLIEKYEKQLDILENSGESTTESSKQYYRELINGIILNFDHYDRFLFFRKTEESWPKINNEIPYNNAPVDSTVALNWFNSQLLKAKKYDQNNSNRLINTVPAYIREDTTNQQYLTFIDMIGHHFDNIWIYINNLPEKYNADNRLDRGISPSLVRETLKNFGVTIYSDSKTIEDLFRYFTKDTYNSGEEVINTLIQEGEQVSQKQYYDEIYKRIYHNLPILFKSKGTERSLKVLLNSFGIPNNLLTLNYKTETRYNLEDSQDSQDRVKIGGPQDIAEGTTLSKYTSVLEKDFNAKPNSIRQINIGFEINKNIDEYLKQQVGSTFNIDNYIGNTEGNYQELETVLKEQLNNLNGKFNVKDYIRLIKFYDNLIFKMIYELLPGTGKISDGIIINSPVLHRNIHKNIDISKDIEYITTNINPKILDVTHGKSIDGLSQEYTTNYKNKIQTPTGKKIKKWIGSNGSLQFDRSAEESKYDGELKGSSLTIYSEDLNKENPYKQIDYKGLSFNVRFLSHLPQATCTITPVEGGVYNYYESTYNGSNFNSLELNTLFNLSYGRTAYEIPVINFEQTESLNNSDITVNLSQNNISNYQTINIIANNIDIETNSQGDPGPCTSSIDVQVVYCTLSINPTGNIKDIDGNIHTSLNDYTSYNLNEIFEENQNTNSSYYINDSQGTQFNIPDITNFTLSSIGNIEPNPDNTLTFKIQDNIDTNCEQTVNIQYEACPLLQVNDTSNAKVEAATGIIGDNSLSIQDGYFIPALFNTPGLLDPAKTDINWQQQGNYVDYYFKIFKSNQNDSQPFNTSLTQEWIKWTVESTPSTNANINTEVVTGQSDFTSVDQYPLINGGLGYLSSTGYDTLADAYDMPGATQDPRVLRANKFWFPGNYALLAQALPGRELFLEGSTNIFEIMPTFLFKNQYSLTDSEPLKIQFKAKLSNTCEILSPKLDYQIPFQQGDSTGGITSQPTDPDWQDGDRSTSVASATSIEDPTVCSQGTPIPTKIKITNGNPVKVKNTDNTNFNGNNQIYKIELSIGTPANSTWAVIIDTDGNITNSQIC